MGRLSALLVLLGLGASTGLLPQRLQSLLSRLPQPGTAARGEGAPSTQGMAEVAELSNTLNQAAQAGANAAQGASADERGLLGDTRPEVKVMANPLMAKMLQASSAAGNPQTASSPSVQQQGLDLITQARSFYADNQAPLSGLVWAACIGSVVLAALCLLLGQKGLSRLLCGLVHAWSARWLWIVSLTALAAFLAGRVNLWAGLPSELWTAPAAGLLLSAGLLRTLDMNAPVWNGTFGSLLAPIASCALIAGWDLGAGLLRGLV